MSNQASGYLNYTLDTEGDQYITVATVRPETILGDTAICVHPDDERYKHLQGKYAFVPLINRRIPIIADEYVDPAFGTGALKITPAHDKNDHLLALKHNLPIIDILNDDGTLSSAAGLYIGLDRFEVRSRIVKVSYRKKVILEKLKIIPTRWVSCERTDAKSSSRPCRLQWCG